MIVFAFVGPAMYALTALGLFYSVRLAGFVACFIFAGPGVAELSHFVFPLLEPAILPRLSEPISQAVSNGNFVASMPNYWLGATGRYYFPGLYPAALPMLPGIWAIVRLVSASKLRASARLETGLEISKLGAVSGTGVAISSARGSNEYFMGRK